MKGSKTRSMQWQPRLERRRKSSIIIITIMAEELAVVNSNLLNKKSYKRDEDFLSDWKSRAKNDVVFFETNNRRTE